MSDLNEILPKEPQEVTDLVAMEEGARTESPTKSVQHTPMGGHNTQSSRNLQQKSPQIDTAQHYLDDNFSDVMRSSALGSNVSSLFNTTAFNTTDSTFYYGSHFFSQTAIWGGGCLKRYVGRSGHDVV